ncbi:hypothetical protein ACQB60_26495 [Actinomycetota bacterium Odt1-20B]
MCAQTSGADGGAAPGPDDRVWPGRLPFPLAGLHLWTDPEGEPCRTDHTTEPCVVASTTPSQDAADVPGGSVPQRPGSVGELIAAIPGGFGLCVDAGAAGGGRHLTRAQVDGVRGAGPPLGTEVHRDVTSAPDHLGAMLDDVESAAFAAGAEDIDAAWLRLPSGPAGLLIDVRGRDREHPPPAAALEAALEAVRSHAPQERVRVAGNMWLTERTHDTSASGERGCVWAIVVCVLVVAVVIAAVQNDWF